MYGALILFEDEFIHIVAISFSSLILTELIMVALTIRTWHRLMVLAEVFSLLLYLVSLVVFHEYFGKFGFDWRLHSELLCFELYANPLSVFRLGIHLIMGLSVEGFRHNAGVVFAAVHHKILAQEILAAVVLQAVVEFVEVMQIYNNKTIYTPIYYYIL